MIRRILAVLLSGLCGAILSVVAWAVWSNTYVSSAIVYFAFGPSHTAADEQKVNSFMENIQSTALSADALQRISRARSLPVASLAKNLKIRRIDFDSLPEELKPRGPKSPRILCCWAITFTSSSSPYVAQTVVRDLSFANSAYNVAHHLLPYPDCPGIPAEQCTGPNFAELGITNPIDLHPRLSRCLLVGALAGALAALISIRRWPPPIAG